MAHLSNYISFLFFSTLLLPLQITARDSQYFSKFTRFENNNVKETELPNKEAPEVNKAEQQSPFIPETENSYGLYGHDESNQVPSTTPTSYHPSKTHFQNTNKYYDNDAYNTRFAETGYNKKDTYEGNQYELSDTKYNEEGFNNNKYYDSYQNNKQKYYNNYAPSNRYSYKNNAANNRYSVEQQGMSDTRFLDGGKYFHDIYAEKYNPTNYGDSYKRVNTNNLYDNRGSNYKGNEYQNQEEFEDEQENFEP